MRQEYIWVVTSVSHSGGKPEVVVFSKGELYIQELESREINYIMQYVRFNPKEEWEE